jgi:hypothetical protein
LADEWRVVQESSVPPTGIGSGAEYLDQFAPMIQRMGLASASLAKA